MKLSFRQCILPFLYIVFAVFISIWVVKNQQGMVNSDFFTLWLGAHLTGLGKNIYDPVVWAAGYTANQSTLNNNPYLYPFPMAILELPLGLLPLQAAGVIWLTLSFISIGLVIWFCRRNEYPIASLLLVLLGVLLNRSVVTTIRNGQFGAVFLLVFVSGLWFVQKKKPGAAGIFFALLLLKPTLGIPLAGLISIYLLLQKSYRSVVSIVITTTVGILVSSLIHPEWIQSFIQTGASKSGMVSAYTPTWWGIAGVICQRSADCTSWLGLAGSMVMAIGGVVALIRYRNHWDIWQVGAFSICVTLLITPYLWAYDQILLVYPLLWISMELFRRGRGTLSILFPILYTILGYALLAAAVYTGVDDASVANTLVVLSGLAWTFRQENKVNEE